jgi:hypothetical protein
VALSEKKRAQVLSDAAPVLSPGEQVIDATTGVAEVRRMGTSSKRRATILITDRRVIIFSKKLGGYDVQDYAYGLLTGVDHKKGLTAGHINLRAAGDTANVQQVQKEDVERISQLIRVRMAVSQPHGAAVVTPGTSSVADELTKLAQLRDTGVLSDDEFAAQKAKLLG